MKIKNKKKINNYISINYNNYNNFTNFNNS